MTYEPDLLQTVKNFEKQQAKIIQAYDKWSDHWNKAKQKERRLWARYEELKVECRHFYPDGTSALHGEVCLICEEEPKTESVDTNGKA